MIKSHGILIVWKAKLMLGFKKKNLLSRFPTCYIIQGNSQKSFSHVILLGIHLGLFHSYQQAAEVMEWTQKEIILLLSLFMHLNPSGQRVTYIRRGVQEEENTGTAPTLDFSGGKQTPRPQGRFVVGILHVTISHVTPLCRLCSISLLQTQLQQAHSSSQAVENHVFKPCRPLPRSPVSTTVATSIWGYGRSVGATRLAALEDFSTRAVSSPGALPWKGDKMQRDWKRTCEMAWHGRRCCSPSTQTMIVLPLTPACWNILSFMFPGQQ